MAAVGATTGDEVYLNIANNSISSSMHALGHGHQTYFPFITIVDSVKVSTITLNDLVEKEGLDASDFNVLYLDVQGGELEVLLGASRVLGYIDHVYTEVSTEEHYKDAPLLHEVEHFLLSRGFELKEIAMPPLGHGNALFSRRSLPHETSSSERVENGPHYKKE